MTVQRGRTVNRNKKLSKNNETISQLPNALRGKLQDALRAYERDSYGETLRLLKVLTKEAPRSSLVCELYGLTLYRMGEWQEAIRVLERFERLTGSVDQYPVVADCWRASGDYQKVEEIWEVCRKVSEKEAMAECRIVVAAARADQGDMKGALSLMVPVCREIKHPSVYHLRQWYTLADLYERAGSIIQAKRWFLAVAKHDPELGCAQQRLNALR